MSATDETPVETRAQRILIVDDNAPGAQTTGWMVEMMGFDYRLAHTPEVALADAAAYAPDVVVLDIGLPGMNGFDLCVMMKTLPELAKTVFIAQTGWAQEEYRHRATVAGFEHFLVKPVALETLEAVLKGIFGRIRP